MTKPIGYYTACPQAENLVRLYGDGNLDNLPQVDQAALIAILGLFVYYETICPDSGRFEDAALEAINEGDDETTDHIQGALACLEGIDKDEAISVLQFLVQ